MPLLDYCPKIQKYDCAAACHVRSFLAGQKVQCHLQRREVPPEQVGRQEAQVDGWDLWKPGRDVG